MTQYCIAKAERISRSLEDAAGMLLDKLCEGEPDGVREMAWSMLAKRMAKRMAVRQSHGTCFRLPAAGRG